MKLTFRRDGSEDFVALAKIHLTSGVTGPIKRSNVQMDIYSDDPP